MKKKIKIVIRVEGGVLQGISCSEKNVEIVVTDFDVFDMAETDDRGMTKQEAEEYMIKESEGLYDVY